MPTAIPQDDDPTFVISSPSASKSSGLIGMAQTGKRMPNQIFWNSQTQLEHCLSVWSHWMMTHRQQELRH